MNIRYSHKRDYDEFFEGYTPTGGETLAMEAIPTWLVKELVIGDFFEKSLGKAVCSKSDRYCKSIGREVAKSRMKKIKLTVISIDVWDNYRLVLLADKDKNVYSIKSVNGKQHAYFLGED